MKPSSTRPGTQVVHRVAALMRAISASNRIGVPLQTLCAETGIQRPTAHRILQGLVTERLIRQDPATKRYYLGPHVYEMGLAAAPRMNIRDISHPYLQEIARQTEDTVFLTVRSGLDGVCLDRVEGTFPIRVFVLDVGMRRPLTVGGGAICILSSLTDVEVDRILAANRERTAAKYPGYSEANLRRTIAAARTQGYVVYENLQVPLVRTIAVGVRSMGQKTLAAISLATVSSRLERKRLAEVHRYLSDAASAVESRIADLSDDTGMAFRSP